MADTKMSSTEMKPERSKGGRPPRAPGEKLQRTNLTLRPSLLFGLELLAKAQHRSISQAVEWAVQIGINSYAVDQDGMTLGEVMAAVDAAASHPEKLMAIYRRVPTLLSFEDAVTCEALEHNRDLSELWTLVGKQYSSAESDALIDRIFWKPAFDKWSELQEFIVDRASKGATASSIPIRDILGVRLEGSMLESYERAAGLR